MNVIAFLPLLIGLSSSPLDVQVGEPARLFSLPAINEAAARALVSSNHVSLTDLTEGADENTRGVVIFFFTKDKGGEDLPSLNRLAKKYLRSGVRFLAISVDQGDLGALSDWVESANLEFPVLRDNHRVVATRYQVKQLPMTYVVDSSGGLLSVGATTGDRLEPEIEAQIVPLVD